VNFIFEDGPFLQEYVIKEILPLPPIQAISASKCILFRVLVICKELIFLTLVAQTFCSALALRNCLNFKVLSVCFL
jgi:hypothetical protein